jgi:hypothetical protein
MVVRSVFARCLEVEVPDSSLKAWTNRCAGLPAKTAIIATGIEGASLPVKEIRHTV